MQQQEQQQLLEMPLEQANAAPTTDNKHVASSGARNQPVTAAKVAVVAQPIHNFLAAFAQSDAVIDSYDICQSTGLGVALVALGLLSFSLQASASAISNQALTAVGHGFWCGAVFIITGSSGISARNKRHNAVILFMLLCVLSTVLSIALLVLGVVSAASPYISGGCYNGAPIRAAHALMASAGTATGIASVVGVVFTFRAVKFFCLSASPVLGVVFTPDGNQQVIVLDQQQLQQVAATGPRAPMMNSSSEKPISFGQLPGFYQLSTPHQQTLNMSAQQLPLQPGLPGPRQGAAFILMPLSMAYGTPGCNEMPVPPSYAATESEKC